MAILNRVNTTKKLTRQIVSAMSFLLLSFFVLPAFAQDVHVSVGGLSATDFIANLVNHIPNLTRLVTAFAYVMGMVFVFSGILKLKHVGESRTMMSHEHSLKGPITYIVIGAMLIYLPSTVQVGLTTFWTEPNPYGYLEEHDQWAEFINACFMIVQLVGIIAFIRGLIILAQAGGGHGGHQGGFGKGVTHIIGGILCINLYQFIQVIMVTLGIQVS